MTEREALNKACCKGSDNIISYNGCCIASACMARRWQDDIERRWTASAPEGEGWDRIEAIGGMAHWARSHKTPHGFCGLGGRPQ